MEKRLYKSSKDRMLFGVCGGLGEYLNTDPTIIRLLAAIFFLTVGGFILYLIAGFIIPERPEEK